MRDMPKINFHPVSLFDTVEGESTVWTQLEAALRNRDGDTFYRQYNLATSALESLLVEF